MPNLSQKSRETLTQAYKDILQGSDESARIAFNLLFDEHQEKYIPHHRISVLDVVENEIINKVQDMRKKNLDGDMDFDSDLKLVKIRKGDICE